MSVLDQMIGLLEENGQEKIDAIKKAMDEEFNA